MKRKAQTLLIALAALLFGGSAVLHVVDAAPPRQPLTEHTEAHFIDVGQGDATLLLSGGQAVLIDAGEASAAQTVIDYLQTLGVERLYAVVATHPHSDHIGGLAQVVDAFPIDNFYMGAETANTRVYENLLDALERQSIRPIVPTVGDTLALSSGAVLTFLGPTDDVSGSNLNNRSLVCRFDAGNRAVLLMGDAETPAEASLLETPRALSCDVLKVGHHGADTSSSADFLRAAQPSVAVISCGADNDYGHPSEQTIKRLSDAGVTDLRITAREGTVVLSLDAQSLHKENAA